jgi:hypothetical protein
MGAVLIGVEKVAMLLVRCTIYENLYLRQIPEVSNHANLQESLLELYAAVLEFLASAKRYLDRSSAGNCKSPS